MNFPFFFSLSLSTVDVQKCQQYCVGFVLCCKSLSDLRAFLVKFSGCFKYRILLSENRDNLIFPPSHLYPFYFFLLSYCFGEISSTLWSKNGGRECSFLSPDFQGNAFKFSPFSTTLGIDLPSMGHGE